MFDLHRFLDLALHVFFVWQFPWRVSFVVAIGTDNDVVALVVFLDLAQHAFRAWNFPWRVCFWHSKKKKLWFANGINHSYPKFYVVLVSIIKGRGQQKKNVFFRALPVQGGGSTHGRNFWPSF